MEKSNLEGIYFRVFSSISLFLFILMCAYCTEGSGCGVDILPRACFMSQELWMQVLTFKNQTLVGVQPETTPVFKTICVSFLTCRLCLLVYFTFQPVESKEFKWEHREHACK